MDINEARARLYQTGFIVGPVRRRGAIRELAEIVDPAGVIALAEALGKGHPNADKIADALRQLLPERDAEKVRALWQAWAKAPTPPVAAILTSLGWPPGPVADARTVSDALKAATTGAAAEILKAVTVFARALPAGDEAINDQIYRAWIRSQSPGLDQLITEQERQPGAAGVVALAEALGKGHPNAGKIAGVLRQLSPERDADKIRALWRDCASAPAAAVALVLSHLGWPAGPAAEAKLVRAVLAAAKADAAPDVLKAVSVFARALPQRDEASNDQIYGAWIRSQAAELEQLISEQGRRPGSPALEALHALVTNRLDRYAALKDEDFGLFAQAFALAPEPFRERIAKAVAASPDRRLKEAYRFALTSGAVDVGKSVKDLKAVGDEDGLFEATRSLKLGDVLDLCKRWATNPGRPSGAQQRAAVDRAVAAFHRLGEFKVEPGPALPKGLVDIFEHWRGEKPDDAQLKADVAAEDPLRKARGLYLGHERGRIDRTRLVGAARSEDWPLRLVARLADPSVGSEGKEDPVLWVSACAGDAGLLAAPIGGTPEDYARHSQRLAEARGPAAARSRGLLEILCAFQGVFVASGIEVLETAEATERTAVEVEDASAETF